MKKLQDTNEQTNNIQKDLKEKISPQEIKIINELQILQFLDNIVEDPFLYLYNRFVQQFKQQIENFIEISESDLKEIWNENKKELENILKYSEEIARQKGISKSMQKETLIYSIPIYILIIGCSFFFYFYIPPDYIYFFFLIPFMFLCICNSLISRIILKKRLRFRSENTPIFKEQMKKSIERIRNVNQILINDIRDIIKENKFEPSKFKVFLYNKNYKNIKVLETQIQQDIPIHSIEIDLTY